MLEEGVGDHGQQRVTMKASPGTALEVVEAELFLELLAPLLADPAGLDGGGEGLQFGVGREVGIHPGRAALRAGGIGVGHCG